MNYINTTNIKYKFDRKHLKQGCFSSQYFLKTQTILKHEPNKSSVLQFSILNEGEFIVAGIGECVSLLKQVLPRKVLKRLKIYGRRDGEKIDGNKNGLLYLEGNYRDFCFLENIIDGILNARIGVATRAYQLQKSLAPNQEIIYMADRNNDYCTQAGNGLAAYLGGIKKFSTLANLFYIDQIPHHQAIATGTMPHALIQQFHGDIAKATKAYLATFNHEKVTVLLDYHNNVLQALEDIQNHLDRVGAVRLDTSKFLVDQSLNDKQLYGVNSELVSAVRTWLNNHHGEHVKIIVSSGIDDQKIQLLNRSDIKPDCYGVGGFFLSSILNITADLICLNGQCQVKVGRQCYVDDFHHNLFRYN